MKTRISVWCVLVLGVLSLWGCPSSNEHKGVRENAKEVNQNLVTDATGITFTMPANFSRLVSLVPYLTDDLKILDAESRLIGKTDYCKAKAEIASIGNMLDPSLEKIAVLKPDLVLASKEGNRPGVVEKLREMKIPVFVFGECTTWNNIKSDFFLLGRLIGKEKEAGEIISQIQAELDAIGAEKSTVQPGAEKKTGINGSPILPKVFVQLNIRPLMSAGRNTFINEIITMAQGHNIAAASILPWPTMNTEEIIRINPDVIIVSEMGQMTEDAKKIWSEEQYAGVEAVKNNRVFVMEADLLCQPTPRNFINAVKKLREYLDY